MQAENCLPFAVFRESPAPPPELELVDGPAADPPSDEVVVPAPFVPRLATDGDATPPQPAARVATATSESARTAMSVVGRDRIVLQRNPPIVKRL
jgi:hypothetical protein